MKLNEIEPKLNCAKWRLSQLEAFAGAPNQYYNVFHQIRVKSLHVLLRQVKVHFVMIFCWLCDT